MRIPSFICLFLTLAGWSAAQDTNFPVGPQYLMTFGSPLLARPIATPSLSFDTPIAEARTSEPLAEEVSPADVEALTSVLELQRQMALFSIYYGVPRVSVVEISFREPEGQRPTLVIPASILDTGVAEFVDVSSLRLRGYEITLPEAAAYWKARKVPAPHVYTNEDIERLRRGS